MQHANVTATGVTLGRCDVPTAEAAVTLAALGSSCDLQLAVAFATSCDVYNSASPNSSTGTCPAGVVDAGVTTLSAADGMPVGPVVRIDLAFHVQPNLAHTNQLSLGGSKQTIFLPPTRHVH